MTLHPSNPDFVCMACHNYVSAMHVLSGVCNRNHCPYCLCSRHLDLNTAGDRLSACKALMRPIGLTMKRGHNKYAPSGGELMLVHACTDCGCLSINRIAADDEAEALMDTYSSSASLSEGLRRNLAANGILLLERDREKIVQRQLQGSVAADLA